MRRLLALLLLAVIPVTASAQVYNKFGPSNGVLKGATTTYQTTTAVGSDITALFSGTCNSSTFLRGDGSCQTPSSGGTPAGSDNYVQYNVSGSFAASAAFQFDNSARMLSVDTFSGQSTPALRLRTTAGFAGVKAVFDDVVATGAYAGIVFTNNIFTLGALSGAGALTDDGLDIVIVGSNVNSATLKANGSHSLGINNSGLVNVNGATGSAGQFLQGSGLGWSNPYMSVQVTSLGGNPLIAGACDSNSATLTGASAGMGVVATPNTYPGDGFYWVGYVSSTNNVTVKICSVVGGTPTASTYEVRVLP